jgi:hypothetical protein
MLIELKIVGGDLLRTGPADAGHVGFRADDRGEEVKAAIPAIPLLHAEDDR